MTRATGDRIWADDPATGKRRGLTTEEDLAFQARAVVEVLRATGIRVEEPVSGTVDLGFQQSHRQQHRRNQAPD